MSIEQVLSEYGYFALVVGCILEGETILILGAMAAQRGYLDLPLVMLAAFVGSLSGDQLCFQLGRRCGARLLERRPRWRLMAATIETRLGRYRDLFLFGFRFLYGLRVISPFVIGLAEVSALRFTVLNTLGAGVWAVSFALLGYSFGHGVETFLGGVQAYELQVFGAVAAIGIVVWAVRRYRAPKAAPSTPWGQGR